MPARKLRSTDSIERAFQKMTKAIGAEHVLRDPEVLSRAEMTTFLASQKVLGVVRPANRLEVQECLRIANEFLIPVYPVSSGKNWGYGSALPVQDGSLILHLGRLNRIVELNQELDYIVIEAGVTQRQLHDYLREKTAGALWLDGTASSTVSSIIGNTMERGHGTTSYCDHVGKSCAYEVVLADGSVINTGNAAFPGAKTANLDRWGLGPSLDGLFSQSNLGIVTKMTVWLMRKPEFTQALFFSCADDVGFAASVDAVRKLRLSQTITCGPHYGNVYTSLLRVMSYPWELMKGQTPLMPETAKNLASQHGIGAWNGAIPLYGTVKQVSAAREAVECALKGKTSKMFFYDENMDTDGITPKRLEDMKKLYSSLTGGIEGVALPRTYWRVKKRPPADPDQIDLDSDKIGLIYTGASSPFTGAEAINVSKIVYDVFLRNSFEPVIGIYPIRDRVLNFHICLSYDRGTRGEDEKAFKCQAELNEKLQAAGYIPHRLGLLNMNVMQKADPRYLELLRKMKDLFDPNHIIAPGRYGT